MGAIKSKNTGGSFSATQRGLRSNSISIQNGGSPHDFANGESLQSSTQNLPELFIKTITWQRDSHGLFDYEGKETERKQIRGTGTFSIMRDQSNIEVKYKTGGGTEEDNRHEESKEEETPSTQIAKIVEKNGDYWIYHKSSLEDTEEDIEKNPETKLWYVVKHCKVVETSQVMHLKSMLEVTPTPLTQGYRLMPNDVIKLGRVRFKVREIISPAYSKKQGKANSFSSSKILNGSKHEELPVDFKEQEIQYSPDVRMNQSISALRGGQDEKSQHMMILRKSSHGSNMSSSAPVCRICLSEEDEPRVNPLFSPCKCAGTMRYIHLHCLQEWLNCRMIKKETVSTRTFYWKDLNCELCKTAFPNYVKSPWQEDNDKEISLHVVNYEKPSYGEDQIPAYLVLESITNAQGKVIHVVDMSKCTEAKIGRGNDVDVRITDISVSRLHAHIKKTPKGYFYVQDNKSKFGTLTLIRSPIMLHQTEPNFIQAGRTMLEMQQRLPVKIWKSCFCNGSVKQKKKTLAGQKLGLTTLNGLDYFPEDFLNIKIKHAKKADVDNLQQVENLELDYFQGRPISIIRPAENVNLNQVQPLEFNPLPISAELIQQLNLIREESLDINYSLGPSVLEQQNRGASSLLQPSYFSVHQALQQLQVGSSAQYQDTEQQNIHNSNERNMINLIQAELENSLSRLMDDHQKSEFEYEQSENIRHNGSMDLGSSPFVNGQFINIQEEIKEVDEALASNEASPSHNLHRAMNVITPIKAQNFFAQASVAQIPTKSDNTPTSDNPLDTAMNNNKVLSQLETDGDFKQSIMDHGSKEPARHVLVENQSLPTGRFIKGVVLNESASKDLEHGFSNIFPTNVDMQPREVYQSPYHNPLATTYLQDDFKTIEFRGDQQSMIMNSPFPLTAKNEQLTKVQSTANYRHSTVINPLAQAKNQRILQNGQNHQRLSLPSQIAPIASHLTLNAGNNLFSPIDSSVRKSSNYNSPMFKAIDAQRPFLGETNGPRNNLQNLISATSEDFVVSPQNAYSMQNGTFQLPSQRQLESLHSANKSIGPKDSNIKRMQAIASSYGVDMPKVVTNSGSKKK